jgi:hypothetical protein
VRTTKAPTGAEIVNGQSKSKQNQTQQKILDLFQTFNRSRTSSLSWFPNNAGDLMWKQFQKDFGFL